MAVSHVKSLTIGDFTGTVTAFNSQGSTTTVAATDLARPADWNSGHNQYFTLTGNTSGSSTASGTNIILSGGANITLQGSGASIGIIGRAPDTVGSYFNADYVQGTQTQTVGQSTYAVIPIEVNQYVTASVLRFMSTVSIASTNFASTANTTMSYNQAETHNWVLYSRGTGASSLSLQSLSSGSQSLQFSMNIGYGSASNTSQGGTFGLTYYDGAGTKSFSTTYSTSNSASMVVSTGNLTRLSGMKFADFPFVGSLDPNRYFLAFNSSTKATTQGTNMSGARLAHSHIAVSQPNNTFAYMGQPNNASIQIRHGFGSFTTVGGASTASMDFSNVSSSASHNMALITLANAL